MNKLMTVAMIAAVACGCVSIHKNDGGDNKISPNVIKDTIHEKYTVGKDAVAAQDQINCLFGFICWGSTATHVADVSDSGIGGAGKAKNGAYANACDAAKCDAIVGTKYTVTTFDDYFVFKRIKAEISGYPVTLTGAEVIPADKTQGFCQGAAQPACKAGRIGL